MTTLEIIELVGLCVIAAALIAYVVVMAVKNKWLSALMETIESAIAEAEEKYPDSGSGEEKKAYVLEKVKAKAEELGLPYNLLKAVISALIDKIIANYNVIAK